MKKVFRLANAEFNKIFLRPSIFILTAFLIVSLIVSNVLFKPVESTKTTFYENAVTVGEMFTLYNGSTENELVKITIDKHLEQTYNNIFNEYESLTKNDELKTFTDSLSSLDQALTSGLREEKIYISGPSYNQSKVVSDLENVKTKLADFLSYLPTLKSTTLNFYITYSQYDTIYENVKAIYGAFPQTFTDKTEKQYFIDFCDSILDNYNLDKSINILSKIKNEKIEIDENDYNKLKEDYYTKTKQTLEQTYFDAIENFYNKNYSSSEKTDLQEMQKLILNYNSFEKMNATLLNNKFMLLKVGEKTDTEIKDIIGYSEISKYQVNEQIAIFDYLIANNKFDYNYLTSFNFNVASGQSTNAYDYTIYSMQILNLLIIIFTIFYACSSIAGDQSSGTMKMIAIRPYTKTKLFAGKFLSCFMFGTMLTLISFVASLVVGIIAYGLPMMNCLIVFDSRIILTINPFLLLLTYLVSCFVNLLFYISLSMFVCLIFKSNTLSVFLTALLYGIQIVLSGVVNKVWLIYTPFAHFDLFKYFGNSSFGFLKFNILPDTNFATSALVIGFMIVIMNILSNFIFKKRDIT